MNEKLNQNTTSRIYVNNAFGKKINGMIGPVHHETKRTIFAQAKPGSTMWEVGEIDIVTGIITASDDNINDARTVIEKL